MPTPSDPNEPTRADLPPTAGGAGDPTMPMERTEAVAAGATTIDDRPPVEDEEDRRKAWWLWAVLAAVLIAIVLFALLRDGDDDGDVGTVDDVTTEETAVPEDDPAIEDGTAPEDTAAEDGADTAPGVTDGADGGATAPAAPAPGTSDAELSDDDPGIATAEDGTDLFAVLQSDAGDAERLAPYAGQDVVGSGVQVLEVVDGEGFWIGAGDQRIFAHGAADLAAEVEVGQRIDFDGFLKPNPPADSAEVHDIPEDQGAELHRQQGHHVELRSLTPVG